MMNVNKNKIFFSFLLIKIYKMSQDLISKENMQMICKVSVVVAAIGAINWYTASMGANLVAMVAGSSKVERFIYLLVGIAGVIVLYCFFNDMVVLRQRMY